MKMETIFRLTQNELKHQLHQILKKEYKYVKNHKGYLFAQGEVPVMLVAHLDTVHLEPVKDIFYTADGKKMMSPQGIGGDDRCGVYMILEIIKKLKCSVLFCEDEEKGGIGASLFAKSNVRPRNINYMIEFDRMDSNDAVFYECDNPKFTEFVTNFGFVESWGSFSDISFIAPELKMSAVNLSCGYYNPHTKHEYVNLDEMHHNIQRAMEMIVTKTEQFEYIEALSRFTVYKGGKWQGGKYQNYGYEYADNYGYEDDIDYELQKDIVLTAVDAMFITNCMGFIIDPNGDLDDSEDYFIDKNEQIYVYCWKDCVGIPVDGYRALTNEGHPMKFDMQLADILDVYI